MGNLKEFRGTEICEIQKLKYVVWNSDLDSASKIYFYKNVNLYENPQFSNLFINLRLVIVPFRDTHGVIYNLLVFFYF